MKNNDSKFNQKPVPLIEETLRMERLFSYIDMD